MASNTIPFPNVGQMKRSRCPQRDQAIAERMRRAVAWSLCGRRAGFNGPRQVPRHKRVFS